MRLTPLKSWELDIHNPEQVYTQFMALMAYIRGKAVYMMTPDGKWAPFQYNHPSFERRMDQFRFLCEVFEESRFHYAPPPGTVSNCPDSIIFNPNSLEHIEERKAALDVLPHDDHEIEICTAPGHWITFYGLEFSPYRRYRVAPSTNEKA